ncbi:MAG: hypothetical protein GEU81_01135 [Nitriliruptorales bacterium]|nr:hypothetical protein [Nitriliruptorales bacterium]
MLAPGGLEMNGLAIRRVPLGRSGRVASSRGRRARHDRSAQSHAHTALLVEVRAALAAGAAPGTALIAGVDAHPAPPAPLRETADAIRLGRSLMDAAAEIHTGDAGLDLLVRALGVAERSGAGGVAGVDQALAAASDEAETARRLRVKTAQAHGTAGVLTVLPVVAWLLFVVLDPAMLGFYVTPVGALSGVLALALAIAGRCWSTRIVRQGSQAAAEADPLHPPPPRPDVARAVALAAPGFLVVAVGAGFLAGAAVAAAILLVGLRRPAAAGARSGTAGPGATAAASPPGKGAVSEPDRRPGGAAETVELVAVALAAGLPPAGAIDLVALLAPSAARPLLTAAGSRLRAGWEPAEVLSGTGLAPLGAVLGASERWGAPAEPALRRLAAELRATRRSAAEEAAERTQLHLVFPTTLLTLPAFTMGVVPPMLWTAFVGAGG